MGRLYRINPMCPGCKEEHMYWDVRPTDDEQERLDHHTEMHKGESELYSLLSQPAIIITSVVSVAQNLKQGLAFGKKWKLDDIVQILWMLERI